MNSSGLDAIARTLTTAGSRRRAIQALGAAAIGALPVARPNALLAAPVVGGECVPGETCERFGHCIDGYCIKASQKCINAGLGLLEQGFSFNAIYKKLQNSNCGTALLETFFHFFDGLCSQGTLTSETCSSLAPPKKDKKKKKN